MRSLLHLSIALLLSLIAACSDTSRESLREPIPPTGVAAAVQINLPRGAQEAQVAATVFKDAETQLLVGGDVIKASTSNNEVLLKSIEQLSGNYEGYLHVGHPDNDIRIAVKVEYDPMASVQDRWFASPDLMIDPGPGQVVDYGVQEVQFPPEVRIEHPQQDAHFTSRGDEILLIWNDVNQDDQMRVGAAVSCELASGRRIQYSVTHVLGRENGSGIADGQATLNVSDLVLNRPAVYGANTLDFLSMVVMASVLEAFTFGLLRVDSIEYDSRDINGCDIDLTLFRERSNSLGDQLSGGYAISSRSDSIQLTFTNLTPELEPTE